MTVSKFIIFFLFFVLLFPAKEVIHAQNGVCRITAYSIDSSIPHSARFSDTTVIREFNLKIEDDFIPETFQHKESGISISVSTMRVESPHFKQKTMAIKLAIQLFKDPQEPYGFYGGSAESIYDKNWKGLSVSSHIKVAAHKGYTFTFTCEKRKLRNK